MEVSIGTRARTLLAGFAAFLAFFQQAAAGPALVTEPSTGLVLYAEDADQPWRPASLTKLMTAYIAFEAIRDGQLSPEDVVISTPLSQSQPPSKLGMPLRGAAHSRSRDQGADCEVGQRCRDDAGGEDWRQRR